jgi:thiol-disulfide isomerase/thioredoxin
MSPGGAGPPAPAGRTPSRRAAGTLLAGLVVAAGLAGCTSAPPDGAAGRHAEAGVAPAAAAGCPAAGGAVTGQPALPELTLPCLGAGDPVPLRRLAGTPTVLNIWASWCGPCRAELPAFQQLSARAAGRLRVLGVVTEDAADRARAFAAGVGVRFPSVLDDTGRLNRALGRTAVPGTVLVAADGRVAKVYSGPPLSYDELRRLVRDTLGVAVA